VGTAAVIASGTVTKAATAAAGVTATSTGGAIGGSLPVAGTVAGEIVGGATLGAVTAVTTGTALAGALSGAATASMFAGPIGLAILGADGYTWDCWKPVVTDDSVGPSCFATSITIRISGGWPSTAARRTSAASSFVSSG
jgi:hypothetical protein